MCRATFKSTRGPNSINKSKAFSQRLCGITLFFRVSRLGCLVSSSILTTSKVTKELKVIPFETKMELIRNRRILRERKAINDLVEIALKRMETEFHYQHVELTPREKKNIKASEFLQL